MTMIVHTVASTFPALFAKKDIHGYADTEIQRPISAAMNMKRGPNLFSNFPKMKICTKTAETLTDPNINPISCGLRPSPPAGIEVEYMSGISTSFDMTQNVWRPKLSNAIWRRGLRTSRIVGGLS